MFRLEIISLLKYTKLNWFQQIRLVHLLFLVHDGLNFFNLKFYELL